jgi:hypothetical protein
MRGDWSNLWQRFKAYIHVGLGGDLEETDPSTFGLYKWLEDTAIPALETLAGPNGPWVGAWSLFKKHVDEALAGKLNPTDFAIYTWLKDTGIPLLETLATEGWKGVWDKFKEHVDNALEKDPDPEKFTLYTVLRDIYIPLLEGLTAGDGAWTRLWKDFSDAALGPFKVILDFYGTMTTAIVDGIAKVDEVLTAFKEKWAEFMGGQGFPTNPFTDPNWSVPEGYQGPLNPTQPPPIPPSGKGGQDWLPPSDQASYPGGPVAMSNDTYFIEQNIGLNGDFGGARQGAQEGIRQALLARRTTA